MAARTAPVPTRERIVTASAELFRRQGYNATGLKRIVAEANAPFGSVYHFFPGGKEQLGAEVIRRAGPMYFALFVEIIGEAADVETAVRDFFAGAAQTLRDTDYADACPIATIALEVASASEVLRQATAEVFTGWIEGVAQYFAFCGMSEPRAREVSLTILSLLEGAFIFCRALRSTAPMDIAGAAAVAAVHSALSETR
jgi:AcrR family transcriptional regulator